MAEKMKKIDSNVMVSSYRLFSKYIGEDINIIPGETRAAYIEPIFNIIDYCPYYEDKNNFDVIVPKGYMPITINAKN